MKIKTITVGRTFNLGDYNSLKIEITADLDGEKAGLVNDNISKLDDFLIKKAKDRKEFGKI